MVEHKPVPCSKCFHFHVCENKHTPPVDYCESFVNANCVEIVMNDDQLREASQDLNTHLEILLNLKRRLDGGERTLDLYHDIIDLDY